MKNNMFYTENLVGSPGVKPMAQKPKFVEKKEMTVLKKPANPEKSQRPIEPPQPAQSVHSIALTAPETPMIEQMSESVGSDADDAIEMNTPPEKVDLQNSNLDKMIIAMSQTVLALSPMISGGNIEQIEQHLQGIVQQFNDLSEKINNSVSSQDTENNEVTDRSEKGAIQNRIF
jgi:hypothetical protein